MRLSWIASPGAKTTPMIVLLERDSVPDSGRETRALEERLWMPLCHGTGLSSTRAADLR
jgi:hypothetical protein